MKKSRQHGVIAAFFLKLVTQRKAISKNRIDGTDDNDRNQATHLRPNNDYYCYNL